MNTFDILSLILSTLRSFSGAVLTIITAVIGVGVAYFVIKWGWNYFTFSFGDERMFGHVKRGDVIYVSDNEGNVSRYKRYSNRWRLLD